MRLRSEVVPFALCELKEAGKVVQHATRTVSKDGQTLTLNTKGTTAKGEKYEDVLVYDRH